MGVFFWGGGNKDMSSLSFKSLALIFMIYYSRVERMVLNISSRKCLTCIFVVSDDIVYST